jgi:hypothetical protein
VTEYREETLLCAGAHLKGALRAFQLQGLQTYSAWRGLVEEIETKGPNLILSPLKK